MGFIRERKLKDGGVRYQAEIRLKGHPMLTARFDRKNDAKAWIQKTEANLRCGRHQLYAESKKRTFAEAVEKYIKERPVSVAKSGHLKWWNKELGALYLQDIRRGIISEKKQKLLTEPNAKDRIRTRSTCNRFLATLSHLMSVCEKQWEWINENPVRKITREKEPRERTRFLSPEERYRFLEACKQSNNPYLFTFGVLLLGTGCRYNEIRCLKFKDLDIKNGAITIAKTKNGDIHSVPVQGLPLKLLSKLIKNDPNIQSDSYIFPGRSKSGPLEFRKAIRTAIKRAGLKSFRPHDCRRSYATELLAMGLSLGEIGRLLNHRTVSTTRRYAQLMEKRSIEAITKMSDEIFKGVRE